jgi:hypothetical protein
MPDQEMPDRLLGTCDECKSWFLIDAVREVMIPLPVEDLLHREQAPTGQSRCGTTTRVAVSSLRT